MFLRSLTIRGFKSFADKTVLEFTPGVSVIVGPNGSGKSNIADAVAWVLGEQGPRALRGGHMTDVIFAGSPSRPALGMAEVRLVIDNSAGLIPVPATEIEISRAVLRSGESEYRLAGRPCRLLDIQELLSDTGLGRSLHTIVSQGHLEDVLSARPEDRRQFIEEAAGIAKHRRRRERAERKLAGLEQDLLRLQDVVAEMRRQLKPLKQQAELAAKHQALIVEARELARKIAAARLRELLADGAGHRPSWQEAELRQAQARARLEELDREISRAEEEQVRALATLRRAEDLQTAAMGAKSDAEERVRATLREEARARDGVSIAARRSGRLLALEEERERTERALEEVRAALDQRESGLEHAEEEFRRAERARRDAEDDRRRLGEEAAARRAERETLRNALVGHDAEGEHLDGGMADVRARIDRLAARAGELEELVERLDAEETPVIEEQAELSRERSEVASSIADLETEERGLLARQEVVDARTEELSESAGAAFARRKGDRAVGLLRDLLGAPAHLEATLMGALGSFADAVVYARRAEALVDAGESASGVTLAIASDQEPRPPSMPGERRLLDLLRPDPRVRGLAADLLGEAYVVRNLAEAAAKHLVNPRAQFVTFDGAVVGGAYVRAPFGHDVRLEGSRRQSAAIERELASVRRRLREGRQRLAEVTRLTDRVSARLEETDGMITRAAEEMTGVEAELASLRREEQMLAERRSAVEAAAGMARERLGSFAEPVLVFPVLPPAAEVPIALRVEVEALRRDRSRLEAGVNRARKEIEALAAEDPVALRRALEAAERDRAIAEEDLRNADGNLAGAIAAYRAAAGASRRAQEQHTEANRAWREQASVVDRVRQDHDETDRARLDLERRIADAERVLREGHGVEPSIALEGLTPEDSTEELQRRSDVVARRLGLLGRVNVLAAEELAPLQERHDFMVRELEDVKAARSDLQDLVQEVDRRMVGLFRQAFDDVATEFGVLFAELFPGGEGHLALTDPDAPLTSGIEVEARPGRKRVRRLSLLSGGERSLAALALLLAIFRARPSPFYLLDEVEAALDDVNLHRFLGVVRSFAADAQMFIVSHQKRTMEMADVLYGVSMRKDGASTVISQRLAQVPAL